jgi:glycosyltransferase involved in cell wall biosynthesis
MPQEESPVLVSICCIVYNQEAFVRQTLEGFLIQQTDFKYEIIIHDDASTDNTADIIREYESKYPDIIKPIYQRENQYSKGFGFVSLLYSKAQGKYLALCEGDDYWTDSLKLQKQVNFLESHSDYGLVHTYYKIFNQKEEIFKEPYFQNCKEGDVFEDLLYVDFIATLTTMARRDLCLEAISTGIFDMDFKMGDYPLWLYIAKRSKIGYIKDCTAIYRLLNTSASHFNDAVKQFQFHKSAWDVSRYFAKDTPYYYWVKFYEEKFVYEFFYKELKTGNDIISTSKILTYVENKETIKFHISLLATKNAVIRQCALLIWNITSDKIFIKLRHCLSTQYHKFVK